MNLKLFGEFIKELREEKKLNQRELAEELHVDRTTVNKWEKGKSIPLNDTLMILSEYFEVTIEELLDTQNPFIIEMIRNDNVFY